MNYVTCVGSTDLGLYSFKKLCMSHIFEEKENLQFNSSIPYLLVNSCL